MKFTAEEFVSMYGTDAAQKAEIANAFVAFVESGYKRRKFTHKLYQALSNMWHHIAHYNIDGFYDIWFSEEANRIRFMERAVKQVGVGDPRYCRVDLEAALKPFCGLELERLLRVRQARKDKAEQERIDKITVWARRTAQEMYDAGLLQDVELAAQTIAARRLENWELT